MQQLAVCLHPPAKLPLAHAIASKLPCVSTSKPTRMAGRRPAHSGTVETAETSARTPTLSARDFSTFIFDCDGADGENLGRASLRACSMSEPGHRSHALAKAMRVSNTLPRVARYLDLRGLGGRVSRRGSVPLHADDRSVCRFRTGVLWHGDDPIPGSLDAVSRLRVRSRKCPLSLTAAGPTLFPGATPFSQIGRRPWNADGRRSIR